MSNIISGVPQGSVLGPILFLIFINDVVSICCDNTTVKLFADDLKLYSVYNSTVDSAELQHSLDKLACWSDLWQLQINLSKCHVLSINRPNALISNISNHYSLNGFILPNVKDVNDLGVYADSNLTFKVFKHHIATVIKHTSAQAFFYGGLPSVELCMNKCMLERIGKYYYILFVKHLLHTFVLF